MYDKSETLKVSLQKKVSIYFICYLFLARTNKLLKDKVKILTLHLWFTDFRVGKSSQESCVRCL